MAIDATSTPPAESAAKALGGARKTNVLAVGVPLRGDRGLEIHDSEVGTAKHWADGSEEEVGGGAELRSDRSFEVDVTCERELDRPTGGALLLGRGRT